MPQDDVQTHKRSEAMPGWLAAITGVIFTQGYVRFGLLCHRSVMEFGYSPIWEDLR